jgi:hypothetical protein
MTWIQVRAVHAEHARLAATAVPIIREPTTGALGPGRNVDPGPDGFRSSWPGFPPITLCAAAAIGVTAKMTNSMRQSRMFAARPVAAFGETCLRPE